MAECPHCEYNKKRAQNWRVEAYRLAGHPLPEREQDEPVAWNKGVPPMFPKQKEGETFMVSYEPKQEQSEPVGWIDSKGNMICTKINESCKPLYTTPQQRKPLTDDEIAELWLPIYASTPPSGIHEDGLMPWRLARAIEAAHGIKENT